MRDRRRELPARREEGREPLGASVEEHQVQRGQGQGHQVQRGQGQGHQVQRDGEGQGRQGEGQGESS